MLAALLSVAPVRGNLDRAALSVHAAMLEHGFVCAGASEPGGSEAAAPVVSAGADGSVTLQLLPPGWNAAPDTYSFRYVHPLRGNSEAFTVKALALGGNLAVHADSSIPGGDLLSATLKIDPGVAEAEAETRAEWQKKVQEGICLKLLGKHDSTARLQRVLGGSAEEATAQPEASHTGQKRPAPAQEPSRLLPGRDPAFPERRSEPPWLWTPGGGLLGPRHPAWGQGVPVGPGRGGGFMPRFDPIGPGGGEPDHDHMPVPGRHGPDFPGFFPGGGLPGGPGGRRDRDLYPFG